MYSDVQWAEEGAVIKVLALLKLAFAWWTRKPL
jgi:hypothetical protein